MTTLSTATTFSTAARIADLAKRYWQFECYELPLFAVLAGEKLPDAVLFRESEFDHQRRYRVAGELLAELDAIPDAVSSAQDRATYHLLRRELTGVRKHYEVKAHLRPSLFPAGPDFTAVFWANSTSIYDAESAQRYVDRLALLPTYLLDIQTSIANGQVQGISYPRAVIDCATANTKGILASTAEASPWFGPFNRSSVKEQPAVAQQAKRALTIINEALIPALKRYANFMAGSMTQAARDSITCTEGPKGHDYYRVLVQHFTTTDISPEQIHDLGLEEVKRIGTEIEAIAAQAGYAGDVAGYRHFLSNDPQFVAPSAALLRESIERLCKRIDKQIPAFFGRIPRITYGVDSMPEAISSKMPPAYAQPSPADGSSAGIFWVSGLPAKCPAYLHVPLAVHEAWPGHLMHIALMQEADHLPAFRRYGAVKYTAYVEGWALYCETLGIEMGLYDTPHQHYGRLEMEMWRAVRLVVDTGIHWFGWNRDKAIAYMSERLTLSKESIEAEVDRYAALPAQALAYQIGNLKLRALRKHAQETLGARFKHRSYHEAVMTTGAVTLPVLEGLIDDWLAQQSINA
jgi:uncharacterized protein (DUF885 family)